MDLRNLLNTDAKLVLGKAENDDPGMLEGYAAVFGNVDRQGDRIVRGAFAKTVAEAIPAGKVPLMALHYAHGGDSREVIGSVVSGVEDDFGLRIQAQLARTQQAQDIRSLIIDGHVRGLSIGYEVLGARDVVEDGEVVQELTEVRLREVTVTARPANELAVITAAKSLESAARAAGIPIKEHSAPVTLADVAEAARALAAEAEQLMKGKASTPESTGSKSAGIHVQRRVQLIGLGLELARLSADVETSDEPEAAFGGAC